MTKVQLFIPCFIDQLYPETGFNTVKILEKAGCKVMFNTNQTCCGQPAFNSGYWKESRKLAVKFLQDFEENIPIVSPSGSCSGFVINDYPSLFKDDPVLLQRHANVSRNLYELSDFLVNVLQVVDFGACFPHKVTYHDSCSALRSYGIKEEPRELLSHVKGLELVEMNESEVCCGFGGTFSIKNTEISTAMVANKVRNGVESGAEYIVTSEASCAMNIAGYCKKNKVPLKVIHLADILSQF
ncbi:(Fe-S)-binding protein [Microbacter margulisiae]|uniref:L-lactate dehydrogenase complex protein LldE n=1 Tax=Microbacter margulisiae TaxID=1350067 RepID=A0A7W5H1Q0_9PORP|nr:(Fe-S)-binding protein [Microbacter margulisiae]MBB3186920.1 L-lactate dehydrogenase complex protein LldE [Microbacter margulisiae]